MPGDVSWCVLPEACPPSRAQHFSVEIAQARDLGFDGGGLGGLRSDPGSRHGGQDLRPSDFVSTGVAARSPGIREIRIRSTRFDSKSSLRRLRTTPAESHAPNATASQWLW